MSSNGQIISEQKEQETPKELSLIIKMHEDGTMTVQGPGNSEVYNEPMCYFLLEKAKDFIKAKNSSTARENSQNGKMTVGGRIRGMFRGGK